MLTIYGRTGRAGNTGWAQFVCVFELRVLHVCRSISISTNYQPSHMTIHRIISPQVELDVVVKSF